MMKNRISTLGIGSILLLTISLYGYPIYQSEFLNWDDPLYLTQNEALLSPQAFSAIWLEHKMPNPYPLTFTMLHLQWKFFGLHSFWFHGVNLFFHLVNIILFGLILKKFNLKGLVLGFPLLLYAIHPVQVETVMWISEFKNILSAFFYWLSFLLLLMHFEAPRKWSYFIVGSVFFVFSLLSKSMTITLPVSLTLWVFLFHRSSFTQHFFRLLPLWIISIVVGLWSMASEGGYYYYRHEKILNRPSFERVFDVVESLYFYVWKFFWPTSLSCVYPQELLYPNIFWVRLTACLGLFLFIIVLVKIALSLPKHTHLALFCIFNYAILAGPILGFFSTTYQPLSLVSDRYNYHPLPFLALLFSLFLFGCLEKMPLRLKQGLGIFLLAWIVFFSIATFQHALVWTNSFRLWSQAVRVNPQEAEVHYNLGATYLERGETVKAKECFEKALHLDPDHYASNNNYGNILVQEEKFVWALPFFERAVRVYPSLWRAHSSLAQIYQKQGNWSKAIEHYKQALTTDDPLFLKQVLLPKLAQLLLEQRLFDEALFYFQELEEQGGDWALITQGRTRCLQEKKWSSLFDQARQGSFPESLQELAIFAQEDIVSRIYWNALRCGIVPQK